MTVPAPDLRDRLAKALRTTPSVLMDTPEERARHAANPRNHHVSHHYYWGCAMCRGEADTLADAVLGIVQPELDQLRAQVAAGIPLVCSDERHAAKVAALEQQLAAVRAYADDLYTAPQKVSACGVRERLLDILTPAGPARTIAEAMAGRPAPVCGDQLLDWACTLPAGPHPDWHHLTSGGNWWAQTRCPNGCGQPNTEHHCTKET